jgi:hypothetical protein
VDKRRPFAHPTYGGGVKDDASLHDEQLESEIRLVGDLVLAALQRERHMSESEIDEVLGLDAAGAEEDEEAGTDGEPGDRPAPGADDSLPPGSKAS